MTVKVSDVMRHVRNHFVAAALQGDFTHASGKLQPTRHFAPGMWVAVTGTDAPSGVYQLDENGGIPDLPDTAWQGTVYTLAPPADFLRLCGDIACWAAAHGDMALTGEKLGQYNQSRQAITWQEAFALALHPYRRMFEEVAL